MRSRTHAITSALLGIAVYPRSPGRAALVTLSGVLIDLDHYVLYALRSGDWSISGAMNYDRRRKRRVRPGDTRPRYGSLRSIVHRAPLTVPFLWFFSWRWPALRPVAFGVTLHLLLDANLPMRLDWRVWQRANGRCERCGVAGLERGVHHKHKVRSRKDYWSKKNRVVWCNTCAREKHRREPFRASTGE